MDLSTPLIEMDLTVLDYETTGSYAGYAIEPWQVGMVTLRDGKVDSSSMFESLLCVEANRPFNVYAPGRHAVLRYEIAQAPMPHELWPQIQSRLIHHPLCAHNVGTEKKFLRAMAPMHRFGPWIDTLKVARKVWPGQPSYALDDLIVGLGLKPRVFALCPQHAAHDALYDAVASAVLVEYLLEQPSWERTTVGEFCGV